MSGQVESPERRPGYWAVECEKTDTSATPGYAADLALRLSELAGEALPEGVGIQAKDSCLDKAGEARG